MALSAETLSAVRECAARSHGETITFPEVVVKLGNAGVDHYEADLLRGQTTYFTPGGDWHAETLAVPAGGAAASFEASGVEAAVRASQRGEIGYNEFLRRIRAAGCVRYFTYIEGRYVAYLGRRGETHVERFLGAN